MTSPFLTKHRARIIASYAALAICALLIFLLSAEGSTASTGRSDAITQILASWGLGGGQADALTVFVRKSAHSIAYFVLGLLAFNAVRLHRLSLVPTAAIAWGFVVLYALSDEFHQSFVPGRSAELRDVLIDSAAGLMAVGLSAALAWYVRGRKVSTSKITKNHP